MMFSSLSLPLSISLSLRLFDQRNVYTSFFYSSLEKAILLFSWFASSCQEVLSLKFKHFKRLIQFKSNNIQRFSINLPPFDGISSNQRPTKLKNTKVQEKTEHWSDGECAGPKQICSEQITNVNAVIGLTLLV